MSRSWYVARFHKDGTLDQTFGNGGWVNSPWQEEAAVAEAIVVDGQGRVIVTGKTASSSALTIARYARNGALDSGFNGTGKLRIGENAFRWATGVAQRSPHFVRLVGQARPHSSGGLSLAFDVSTQSTSCSWCAGLRINVSADGTGYDLVRVCKDGCQAVRSQDGIFAYGGGSSGGLKIWDGQRTVETPVSSRVQDVALAKSGRLYAAMLPTGSFTGPSQYIAATTPALHQLDPAFGRDGFAGAPVGSNAIAVDADQRLVVATMKSYLFEGSERVFLHIDRALPDGSRDRTFGNGTGFTFLIAEGPEGELPKPSLAVRPDGAIVASAGGYDCLRYWPCGSTLIRIRPDKPAPIQGLVTLTGAGSISSQWAASVGAARFLNYEASAVDAAGNIVETVSQTRSSATFANLDEGRPYTMKVTAVDEFGQRSSNVISSAMTPLATATRAVAPSNVSVITDGPGRVAAAFTQTATSGIDSWVLKASASGYPDVSKVVFPPTDPIAVPADTHSSFLSGLQPGVAYSLTVAARTGAGLGLASSPVVRTVNSIAVRPDAPIDLRGTLTNGTLQLNAIAGSDHGSSVTSWRFTQVEFAEDGLIETTIGTSSTPSLTMVRPAGSLQSFRARATNAGGESAPSAILSVQSGSVSDRPTAPTNPAATSTLGSVRVSWTPPSSPGSSPLTGYTVYLRSTTDAAANPDKVVRVGPGQTSVSIPVANACQTQSYAVSASNETGESPFSTDASGTALCAPGSMFVGAEPGNGEAYLRWQFPSPLRTLGVTGYRIVQLTPVRRMVATVSRGTQTFDVSGLTNGTAHRFSIAAYNAAGTGPEVEVSVTPGLTGPPGRVRNLLAEPGNGAITLRWDPPASNGGETIIQYHIIESGYSPTSGEVQTVKGATDASIRTFTLSGYGPDEARFLSVRAFTSKPGPLARVTGYTNAPPAAPVLTNATGGNASATLAWTHAGNGAIPVKGFRLYRTVTGEPTPVAIDVEDVRSVTDTGLTNGITYTYSVVAVNDAGESDSSNVLTATPALPPVPSPLRSLTARVATGQVRLSWTPSLAPGPEPYRVEITRTPVGANDPLVILSGEATAFNDYSVTDGTTYTYTMRALNSAGASSPVSVTATPTSSDTLPPGAPDVDVAAGPGAGQLTVDWDPPFDTGGGAITGYRIYRATTPDGARTQIASVSESTLFYTDSGLGNGTTRFYSVAAMSSLGGGEASLDTPGTTFRTPSVPLGLTLTPGADRVTVSFQEPDDLGGAFPPSYLIYRSSALQSEIRVATITDGATTHLDLGLSAETNYSYRVSASTPAGEGPKTALVTTRTLAPIVPTAPISLVLTEAPQRLDLAWSPPVNNGGAPITNYRIMRGTQSGSLTLLTTVGNVTTYSDTGRRAGVTTFYQVVAVNRAGFSPPSNEVSGAALLEPPSAPRNFTATPTPGTAQQPFATTLRWTPPASDGGAPLTNYAIYEQTGSEPERWIGFVPPAATSITVSGSPVTPYRYRIRALNPLEGVFSAQVCTYHFPWIAELGCPA